MAIPFLNHLDVKGNIDLNDNKLQDFVVDHSTTSDAGTVTGKLIYDSGTLKYYDGSTWQSLGTSSGTMSSWVLEDGDGTEVTISDAKEVKFVEGTGIDINWTDTTTGSDSDPYDLTFGLKNSGVTAGSYTAADITVDAQGRITSASSGTIATSELADDAVTADKLADDAVVTANIVDANVTLAKMAANSVDSDQYVDGSIDTVHLANDAVTGAKLANDITIANDLTVSNDLAVSGDLTVTGTTTTVNQTNLDVSDNIIGLNRGATSNANDSGIIIERGSTGDNAAILWDESADKFTLGTTTATPSSTGNITVTAGTLVVGTIEGTSCDFTNYNLVAGDIPNLNASKITAGTFPTARIADGAITTAKLAADAVNGDKIADDAVDSEHLAADSIDTEHYAAGSVDTTALGADAVTAAKLADNAVVTANIVNANVTTAKIANDAITADKIGDDVINSEHIADGAIDLAHMSANSVDSDQYVDGSIDAAHIASNAITNAKMADDSVGAAELIDDAVGLAALNSAVYANEGDMLTGTSTTKILTPGIHSKVQKKAVIDVSSIDSTELKAVVRHDLGTDQLLVQCFDNTTYEAVICDVSMENNGSTTTSNRSNYLTFRFASVPSNDILVRILGIQGAADATSVTYPTPAP